MSPLLHRKASSGINYRFIASVVGHMCLLETLFLFVCCIVALYTQGGDFLPFCYTLVIMFLVGGTLFFYGQHHKNSRSKNTGIREGMLSVTTTWLILSLIGMLPFIFGRYTADPIDAFFETVSGFTTTGATIFTSVHQLPVGILLWRSLMQWQGGIGIVVFTLALMPTLGSGGGLLYNAETTGIKHDRFMPRITEVARRLWIVYVGLTILLCILLMLGNMNFFEAVCHALTCISTGGYSTRDSGILEFNSPYIEYVITIFMFIGSLNVTLLFFALWGKPKKLFKDEEFRWFCAFVGICIFLTTAWLSYQNLYDTPEKTFRYAAFQVISLISSTGYVTADMNEWHPLFFCLGMAMMAICGCAGSTAGGLKMSRFMVMVKNLNNEFKKRIHPRMVTNVRFNGNSISGDYVIQVLAFISLYISLILLGTIALTISGNDFITAASSAFTCISNVGPSFGKFSMHFAYATGFEKIVLSLIMLAGRLEVFTVICILQPVFWRR